MEDLKIGIYKHYKGGYYQLLGVAGHSENRDEKLVIYVALTLKPGPRMWARPLAMWNEIVKWPDGSSNMRFVYVGNQIPES